MVRWMDPWLPSEYGELFAADYDTRHPIFAQEAECLVLLSEYVKAGASIVELGAGTGRVALPLARAGYHVHAVDSSPAMLARLQEKPGTEDIDIIQGDIGTCVLPEADAMLCLFNTFFQLQTQEAQVSCFRLVSKALTPGGIFVLDAWVPDFRRYREQHSLTTVAVEDGSATLEAASHDPVAQVVESQSICVIPGGITLRPQRQRYAWPAELDLMAQLAHLKLVARYTDWTKAPFGASSIQHLSLYAKSY